jgi:preprotein translocase subunit SecE|tara:strand:+ start:357 stop:548 length:192 start_codon:yes stop_codon:yes gene_type:complete
MFNSISDYFAGVKKEMKKVSWLSKNEILGSTLVVGIFSIIVALFLFVVDFGLTEAMSMIMGVK